MYEAFYQGLVQKFKLHSRGYQAVGLCPLHKDDRQSFSVNVQTGQWFCFAGCGAGNHITLSRRLGLPVPSSSFDSRPYRTEASPSTQSSGSTPGAEAQAQPPGRGAQSGQISEIYTYQYEDGSEAFQVLRYEPKSFRQRHRVNGEWVWKTEGLRTVPYRLPQILAATSTIILVEGEKDVHSLEKLGFVATTTPRGASSWREEYGAFFSQKRVAILPDNDPAGEAYAQKAAANITQSGGLVKLVRLPGLGPKEDVSDFIQQGGTADQILSHIRAAAPYQQNELTPQDPVVYFQQQGVKISDGSNVLPTEWKDLCRTAYREFARVAGQCRDEVVAKINEAEAIWKKCRTQAQYLEFIGILRNAHQLSVQ